MYRKITLAKRVIILILNEIIHKYLKVDKNKKNEKIRLMRFYLMNKHRYMTLTVIVFSTIFLRVRENLIRYQPLANFFFFFDHHTKSIRMFTNFKK